MQKATRPVVVLTQLTLLCHEIRPLNYVNQKVLCRTIRDSHYRLGTKYLYYVVFMSVNLLFLPEFPRSYLLWSMVNEPYIYIYSPLYLLVQDAEAMLTNLQTTLNITCPLEDELRLVRTAGEVIEIVV